MLVGLVIDGFHGTTVAQQVTGVALATVIAFPIAAIALFAVGLPLTSLLWRFRRAWWMALMAAVSGAALGRLVTFLLDFDRLGYGPHFILDHGVVVGATTGLLWYVLARSRLRFDQED